MTEFQRIETNGIFLRVAMAGPVDGPLVILVHGFPESWYSWRRQIEALSAEGYRVAAPDVRGYGGSDRPAAIEAYDLTSLTADLAGLAAALSPDDPAVVVGHDWGAFLAWHSALLHPTRFRAVAGLSVPYTIPEHEPDIDKYQSFFTDRGLFFYQVYFQEEGLAEAELDADPEAMIVKFYFALCGDAPKGTWPSDKQIGDPLLHRLPTPTLPLPWLSQEDVDYYVSQFKVSGFRGPLNRYRNSRRDHAMLSALGDNRIHQPSLFIGGEKDLVMKMYPPDLFQTMKTHLPGLQGAHLLEGCGHWTQQERGGEVNRLLLEWLAELP